MPETATRSTTTPRGQGYDLSRMASLARAYHQTHGRWPTTNDRSEAEQTGRTWSGFQSWLRKRGSSLTEFLDTRFPERKRAMLSLEDIAVAARDFANANGQWPTCGYSDPVGTTGETWQSIDIRLRRSGKSLSRLLDSRFGVNRHRTQEQRSSREPTIADAELKALIAAKPRPVYGPRESCKVINTGERDYEIDDPKIHGVTAVPDSRTPSERARAKQPGFVPLFPGHEPTPVGDLCADYIEEFRRVKRRHRRIARAGGWKSDQRAKLVGNTVKPVLAQQSEVACAR